MEHNRYLPFHICMHFNNIQISIIIHTNMSNLYGNLFKEENKLDGQEKQNPQELPLPELQQMHENEQINMVPPHLQPQYDAMFSEEEKNLLTAFMQTESTFVTPPINDNISNNAYRLCFEKTIESMTGIYTMFGQKYDLKKSMKLKPSRTINTNLRGDLKISAYQLFNQLLDTFTKLSKDSREGVNVNFKATVIPFIKRFLRDIQQLRLYYIRRQIMAKIEEEIKMLNKETGQILDVLDDMGKYVEQNYDQENMSLQDEGIDPEWENREEEWNNVLN